MKSLIYTFLALFIWTMVPVDAIASRDNHQNRQSTSYRESTNYDRHGKRDHNKKHYRKHQRKAKQIRPRHWQPTQRVRYIPAPVYRSYVVPSGYVYSASPGVTLYFSW